MPAIVARGARMIRRVARLPLRLIPPSTIVRVLSGPMRGSKWVAGSCPHAAWIGTFERAKLRHFVGRLSPGMTVWDIGANVGVYALSAARSVGRAGRVYAIEPMAENIQFLLIHIALNHIENVVVLRAAATDTDGTARMARGDSLSESHLNPAGDEDVRSLRLDSLVASGQSAMPDVVKIDVEGAEGQVLCGGGCVFAQRKPLLYLSLHGSTQRERCQSLLTGWGYRITSLEPSKPTSQGSEWVAEPNCIAY